MKLADIHIPDRLRRPLKWVGYPVFGLFVFVLSLFATLPRDKIRDIVETRASAALDSDVSIAKDDFGLTLFGPGFSANTMVIKSHPSRPDEKPVRFGVDDLVVHVSLYELARGFADASFSLAAADGKIAGSYHSLPDDGALVADLSGISIGKLPGLMEATQGVPVNGTIDAKIDVDAPKNLAAQANGSITVTIDNASVGDGKTKLALTGVNDPFLAQGITLPHISLGRLAGSVSIEKGKATFHDVRAHSKDVDIELEGYIELRDPVMYSQIHAYLKFKPSEALIKREPTIELMNNMLGTAKRMDGYLGFSITGTLASRIVLPAKEPPFGVSGGGATAHGGAIAPPPPHIAPPMHLPPPPTAPSAANVNYEVPAAAPPPPENPPPSNEGGNVPPAGTTIPTLVQAANAVPPPATHMVPAGAGGPTPPPADDGAGRAPEGIGHPPPGEGAAGHPEGEGNTQPPREGM